MTIAEEPRDPGLSASSLARAGALVAALYLASRLAGWLRVIVISATFGASRDLDTFYAAFRIPDAMFQLVAAGALGSALIPILSGLLATGATARAWRVASTVTNYMLIALAVLGALAFVAAPVLVPLITPGFDAAATDRTVELTRIMLMSPVFLALGAVATSVLNSANRFGAAALAPIVYNLAIIAGAVLLAPTMGVTGLAIAVVAGSVLHLLVQLPGLRSAGARFVPRGGRGDPATREAFLLMAPRALGLGVSQVTLVVATSLASGLAVGSITAFNVAFTILQIPIGVIGVPVGIVVLPSLSRQLAQGAVEEFLLLLTRSLRLLIFVMALATTLGMVLRRPLVALLFDYGKFGQTAVDMTAATLLFLLLGLVAESMIVVLARGFYAGHNTRTPVASAILAVVINVVLGFALIGPLGLAGLGIALAAGAWAEAVVLLVLLDRQYAAFRLVEVAHVLGQCAVAGIAAAAAAFAVLTVIDSRIGAEPGKLPLLVEVIAAGGAGCLVYAAVAAVLRVSELKAVLRMASGPAARSPRA